MKLVVDASVSLKSILPGHHPEHNRAEAAAVLSGLGDGNHEAVQPIHWIAEVMGAVARLDAGRIDGALTLLNSVPYRIEEHLFVYREAALLASRLKQHFFDTLYHAVALEHGATLVTADRRYFAAARGQGHISLLSDLDLSA